MRIDCHVHVFADTIVERAMATLRAELPPGFKCDDGRMSTLVQHLERHQFDHAIVASIATKPPQFKVIREWSTAIRNGQLGEAAARKLIPFLSVHPTDPQRFDHLEGAAREGFKGVKLHPYYQNFRLDDPAVIEMLRCARDNGLVVLLHSGYDIAFPRDRICDPAKIVRLAEKLPDLKLIAAHFGGWEDWEQVEKLLIGQPVAIDTSMARGFLQPEKIHEFLLQHPPDRLLYGSDWPWNSQQEDLDMLRSFNLAAPLSRAVMGENAARILELKPETT